MTHAVLIPFKDFALDGILTKPAEARWLFVVAHGAGAGMEHPFLQSLADESAKAGLATLRFQFPYMQKGRRIPDREDDLLAALDAVWDFIEVHEPHMRIIAGGKSMGGRMISRLMSSRPRPWIEGLIFVGFPLHPAKKPSITRSSHLMGISVPMLFLQGTNDALAEETLIKGVCDHLGSKAQLHFIQGADHSFKVPRRWGKTSDEMMQELVLEILRFCDQLF